MRELSLHILDLLQNAREAQAKQVEVDIDENTAADRLTIVVRDDGRGMDAETQRRALDPFFTTRNTRHVGLGLPLLAAAARQCEGDLVVNSRPGQGTSVAATFRRSHVDRVPLGNMTDTLLAFLVGGEGDGPELRYCHRFDRSTYVFDTQAIRADVGDVPFSYPPLRAWLREAFAEGEAGLALTLQGGTNAQTEND